MVYEIWGWLKRNPTEGKKPMDRDRDALRRYI
jgi:hypothetical protein